MNGPLLGFEPLRWLGGALIRVGADLSHRDAGGLVRLPLHAQSTHRRGDAREARLAGADGLDKLVSDIGSVERPLTLPTRKFM
jgi:hypothetical protein